MIWTLILKIGLSAGMGKSAKLRSINCLMHRNSTTYVKLYFLFSLGNNR